MIISERGENMKFGDKLIQLRKKSGLSQEELAAKLNVSRQSVSKWESNNTYPETDKIVQICNIFDCTMDDLINENIKDITAIERKNKSQININFDSLLEFVTKTINMFYSMKFLGGLKCLLELCILTAILIAIGAIGVSIISSIIYNIFSFAPWELIRTLCSIIESILWLVWIIISIIIVIHTFKIRYLDYYEQTLTEEQSNDEKIKVPVKPEKKVEEKKKELFKLDNKPKIIIRDKEPFAFLNILAKIIMWFIKSIVIMIGLFFVFILLLGIIGLVVSISLSTYSNLFIGADIGIIGIIIGIVLMLSLMLHFVLGTKAKVKTAVIIFSTSIILTGIGGGIMLATVKDFTIKDSMDDIIVPKVNEKKLTYTENMIIRDEFPRSYEYIIDNSLITDEIIIKNHYDPRFSKLCYYNLNKYGMLEYNFYLTNNGNLKNLFSIVLNDLKENIFRDYSSYLYMDDISITANEETINKLINNLSKVYIYDIESKDNKYIITNMSRKIISIYNECGGEYNAITGEIESNDSCICLKESKGTGTRQTIEYSCHEA